MRSPTVCTVLVVGIAGGLFWLAGEPAVGILAPAAPVGSPGVESVTSRQVVQAAGSGRMAEWGGIADVFGVVSSNPEQDFVAALRLGKLPEIEAAYQRWMLVSPAEALRAATRLPSEHSRRIQSKALALLAEHDPATFLRYANGQQDHLPAILAWVADSNPNAALRLLTQLPEADAEAKRKWMAAMLPRLVAVDPSIAAQAVTATGNSVTLDQVQQVAAGYARKDITLALQWAAQVLAVRNSSLGVSANQAMRDVVSSLVASAPDAAEQFLLQPGNEHLKPVFEREIAMQKAQDDLAVGWAWLQKRGTPSAQMSGADMLHRWSYTRPQEVARILPTLDPSPVQTQIATQLGRSWSRKRSASFEAWVGSLPLGPIREAALAGSR